MAFGETFNDDIFAPNTNQTAGKPLYNGKTLYLNIFIVCTIYFHNKANLNVEIFILGGYGNAYKSSGTKSVLNYRNQKKH